MGTIGLIDSCLGLCGVCYCVFRLCFFLFRLNIGLFHLKKPGEVHLFGIPPVQTDMIQPFTNTKLILTTVALVFIALVSRAQCPRVFDFYGQTPVHPYWYSCSGNNYSFNLSTPNTWNGFTIDWGDGSPVTSGASWSPPTFQNHLYTAAVETYTVTITETSSGCVVTGTVVMEEATSASIQIPVGGLTQACAPQTMEFINSSTNVSSTKPSTR